LVEPENTLADFRAGPLEKKAARIYAALRYNDPSAAAARIARRKKMPPSVGRRHQFRGLIPRYVLHSVRQRNRLTNRDHSAFADNSLIFEFFPSTQPMVCAI